MTIQIRSPIAVVAKLPNDLREALQARHEIIEYNPDFGPCQGSRIAITTSMTGADSRLFACLPDLSLLLCQGVGLDRIDLETARAKGICVAHTPDIFTEDVADFAIGLTYAAVRKIATADRFVRDGRWGHERMVNSSRLHRKTMGVVGLGKIGAAIAQRAAGIGMDVAWYDPFPKPNAPWPGMDTLADLALRSDVLVIATPGGADTDGLIDAQILASLGPSGWLINISRGSAVNEEALLEALETGRIAGAGLDVFATEPAINPRFLSLPNVVVTPHYASITAEAREEIVALILRNIERFHSGEPIPDAAA